MASSPSRRVDLKLGFPAALESTLIADEGVRALVRALPVIVKTPRDPAARRNALSGTWLCGVCLGSAGMALHHKLCHVLGGAFDLPHAKTHTIVLRHALAYNAPAAPEAARIAAAMGVEGAAQGLYDLIGRLGARRALRDIGMPEDGVEQQRQRTIDALPKPDKLIRHRQAAPSDQIRLPATPSSLLSRDDPCRRAPRNSGICALGVKRSILTTSPVRPIMIEARN